MRSLRSGAPTHGGQQSSMGGRLGCPACPNGAKWPGVPMAPVGNHSARALGPGRYLKLCCPDNAISLLFSIPQIHNIANLIGPAADLNRPHSLLSNSPPPRKSSLTPVIRLFFFVWRDLDPKTRKTRPPPSRSSRQTLTPPPPRLSSHELINTIHNPLSNPARPPRNIADACLQGLA